MPAYTVDRYGAPALVAELEERHEHVTHVEHVGNGQVLIVTTTARPLDARPTLHGTVTR